MLTRQLAAMLMAGLPLVEALDLIAAESASVRERELLDALVVDVASGSRLAAALRRHPASFDETFVAMVEAGEAGGHLGAVLTRLATMLEQREAVARRVRGALTYPAVVLLAAAGAVALLLAFVVPVFESMFASSGVALPVPTRVVIALSEGVVAHGPWLGTLAGGLGWLGMRLVRRPPVRRWAHGLVLAVPLLGTLARRAAVARVVRTLGALAATGVGILGALTIAARTAGNVHVAEAVLVARDRVAGGDALAAALRSTGAFPSLVVRMVHAGEQTGALAPMLEHAADFVEADLDAGLQAGLAALEPALLVVLGLVVGGLVVALYLPTFDMATVVG